MAQVIAVGNFKGGVGKTTVSVNLALALREEGHSVLLLDFDGQGQSSLYLTNDESLSLRPGGAERIMEGDAALKGIETASGIDVLHGHRGLGSMDSGPGATGEAASKLRAAIDSMDYDFIVIDVPPEMGFRMIAALMWADLFVIVTTPDPLAQNSTKQFLNVVRGFLQKRWVKPGFRFRILLNMVDRASRSAVEEAEAARANAPQFVVDTELTLRRELVKRAFSMRIPVWQVKRIPKEVAQSWRDLPSSLGLVERNEA